MKKIFLIMGITLISFNAFATQMCARRDTTVIPLDGSVGQTGNSHNADERMWWAFFKYGTVYGLTTCLSVPEIQEYVPTWTGSGTHPIIPTDIDELYGRSGTYIDSDGVEHIRKYCYCKTIHPMSSQWLPYTNHPTSDVGFVSEHCSRSYMNNTSGRSLLFNSIGYGYEEIDYSQYDSK